MGNSSIMQTSLIRILLLGITPLISAEKPGYNFEIPCDDTDCRGRYPGGGHCTLNPTSPWCEGVKCKSGPGVNCHCCKNCYDAGCSKMGKGWYCANSTTVATTNKECIYNEELCRTSNNAMEKCWCCPPDTPCTDSGCWKEGGECVKESQTDRCYAVHKDPELCQTSFGDEKCRCCLKQPKPCNETSKECAKRGPGYTCMSREEAADWPVDCEHSCYHNGDRNCVCCPPKPVEVTCVDDGCSRLKGHECKNATEAANWPKRCLESENLCLQKIDEYQVNMTADNQFNLIWDGALLGSGNEWWTTYTFDTDALVLGVIADNIHPGTPAGIILSTSSGLVTDKSWKCIKSYDISPKIWTAPGFNDDSWPYAVSFGYNGVGPWGSKPGISPSAQWIWAEDDPTTVYCRKKLEIPQCFCCPPLPPVNDCIDNGCEKEAFGENYIGECRDVTNPNLSDLSETFDLTATPTGKNLCKNTVDSSCCRCFKKKPCIDDGCKDAFNGDGVCVDVENDDLSIIDLTVDKKLGLCKNNLKKDCCHCYKKKGTTDCGGKCTYKDRTGVCVQAGDDPPPNHKKTDGKCPGKDCVCWVPISKECSRDPVCERSLRGQCLSDKVVVGPPNYRPSTYKCKDQDHKNCTCWTPHCENPVCTQKGGLCILPWEEVPAGYTPTEDYCNEELGCQCYARKSCEPTKECERFNGKCRYRDEPIPAEEVAGDYCDYEAGCKCWYRPCYDPDCIKARGLCVSPNDPVPNSRAYSHKEGDNCSIMELDGRLVGCKCYRPKCANTRTCTKLGGQCYMPGMEIPAGAEQIPKKGKPVLCNKKLKCLCYKVPIAA